MGLPTCAYDASRCSSSSRDSFGDEEEQRDRGEGCFKIACELAAGVVGEAARKRADDEKEEADPARGVEGSMCGASRNNIRCGMQCVLIEFANEQDSRAMRARQPGGIIPPPSRILVGLIVPAVPKGQKVE